MLFSILELQRYSDHPKGSKSKYDDDLRRQMEEKKYLEEERKRKENEEEANLDRRIKEQQAKMKAEYEEEQNKKKAKEEAVSKKKNNKTQWMKSLLGEILQGRPALMPFHDILLTHNLRIDFAAFIPKGFF